MWKDYKDYWSEFRGDCVLLSGASLVIGPHLVNLWHKLTSGETFLCTHTNICAHLHVYTCSHIHIQRHRHTYKFVLYLSQRRPRVPSSASHRTWRGTAPSTLLLAAKGKKMTFFDFATKTLKQILQGPRKQGRLYLEKCSICSLHLFQFILCSGALLL